MTDEEYKQELAARKALQQQKPVSTTGQQQQQ
jgi:hypothetical protein